MNDKTRHLNTSHALAGNLAAYRHSFRVIRRGTNEWWIRDMKKFTSKEISNQLEKDGQSLSLYAFQKAGEREKGKRKYKVWQDKYHPQIIYTDTVCRQKIQYMHDNSFRKGFVEKSEYWLYSSARSYILNDDSVLSIKRAGAPDK